MTLRKWNNRKVEKFEDTEIICVNRGEYKECKDLKNWRLPLGFVGCCG